MAEQTPNPAPGTGTVKLSKIKLDPARERMNQAASQIPVAPHRPGMTPSSGTISAVEQKTITPPVGATKLTLKLKSDAPQTAAPAQPAAAAPAVETPAPQKLDTTTMRLKIRRQPAAPGAMPSAPATTPNQAPAANTPAAGVSPMKLKPLSTSSSIPVTAATQAPAAPAQPAAAAPAVTKRPTVAIPAATVEAFAAAPTIKMTDATPAPAPIPAPPTAKEVSDDATVKIARPSRSVPIGTPGSLIPNTPAAGQETTASADTSTAAKTIKLTAAMKPLQTQTATSPVPKVKPIPQPIAVTPSAETTEAPQAAKTIKLTAAVKPQMTQTATSPVPKVTNVPNIASAPTIAEKAPEQPTGTQAASSAPTIKLTAPVTEAANSTVSTNTVKLSPPKLATLKKPEAVTPSAPTVAEKTPEIQKTPAEPSTPTVSEFEETVEELDETPVKKGFDLKALLSFLKPKAASAEEGEEETTEDPIAEEMPETEAVATTAKAEPGVAFLIVSIVAMLALIFCLFVMTVQYLNMYEGKNIKVPGWEELSGVKK